MVVELDLELEPLTIVIAWVRKRRVNAAQEVWRYDDLLQRVFLQNYTFSISLCKPNCWLVQISWFSYFPASQSCIWQLELHVSLLSRVSFFKKLKQRLIIFVKKLFQRRHISFLLITLELDELNNNQTIFDRNFCVFELNLSIRS